MTTARRKEDLIAVVLAVAFPVAALQAQGSWGAPINLPWDQPPLGGEIAHAALLGQSGSNRGKVFLMRATTSQNGIAMWDPAAPQAWINVNPDPYPPVVHNIFCSGHSFDAEGYLVIAGGSRLFPCQLLEANYSYAFNPNPPDVPTGPAYWTLVWMLQPTPAVCGYGHYYPATVPGPNGDVSSWGGTTGEWTCSEPYQCGGQPVNPPPKLRTNDGQVFRRAAIRWEGTTQGLPGDQPLLGLPMHPTVPAAYAFGQYPILHVVSDGHLLASVVPGGAEKVVAITGGRLFAPTSYTAISVGAPTWAMLLPPSWQWQQPLPSGQRLKNSAGQDVDLLFSSAFMVPWTNAQAIGGDKIVVLGGWDSNKCYDARTPPQNVCSATVLGSPVENDVWQLSKATPSASWSTASWSRTAWPPMNFPRIYANVVVLANLTVMVVGGSKNEFKPYHRRANPLVPTRNEEADADPVFTPELIDPFNPGAGWMMLPNHVSPRMYHAVVLLLPDGRVLVAGGYKNEYPQPSLNHSDIEIYSPAYLDPSLKRPQFVGDAGPTTIAYGQDITVNYWLDTTTGASIEFASLIRCGSATHGVDWDQRALKLDVISSTAGPPATVTLRALPRSMNDPIQKGNGEYVAPPGYYLLFLVTTPQVITPPNTVRVPSVARFVKVG